MRVIERVPFVRVSTILRQRARSTAAPGARNFHCTEGKHGPRGETPCARPRAYGAWPVHRHRAREQARSACGRGGACPAYACWFSPLALRAALAAAPEGFPVRLSVGLELVDAIRG